jgi:FkbM family methyltransferase
MNKEKLAKIILKLTPSKLKGIYEFSIENSYKNKLEFGQLSYSQEGEDMILNRFFGNQESGIYVDVGAHHPRRFSNTYIFYKKGWRGINIDPIPGMIDLFNRERPSDTNLQIGIGEIKGELNYYIFNEPALNTFSEEEAIKKDKKNGYFIKNIQKIKLDTLENILDRHLEKGLKIDFLSIDAEGLDFIVLKSNNFNKYKPKFILIEILEARNIEAVFSTDVYLFLKDKGYELIAKTYNTVFFELKEC